MKERPILFSAPMVRALLDGSKTQTRRGIARLSGFGVITQFDVADTPDYDWHFRNKMRLWNDITHARLLECCPYGSPGDRLWVRETFQGPMWFGDDEPVDSHTPKYCHYKADGDGTPEYMDADDNLVCRWMPSIHMPRWASRITLEITGVRVERLHDISDDDSLAEGIYPTKTGLYSGSPRAAYEELWESINGPGSWATNPFIWVIEFRRVEQ